MKNRLAIFTNARTEFLSSKSVVNSKYFRTQMFYSKKNPQGKHLALCMQKQFVKNLQPKNKPETKV